MKAKLIDQLMIMSDPPAYKHQRLRETYEQLSMRRLLEIRAGFNLAIKGLERRKLKDDCEANR